MSSESHTSKAAKSEHGTTKSYVIGFILSLVFTIIPYYLVVDEVISGSVLLAVILGIAVLQMAIQMFFFLHLGRGPKPLYNVVFFFATAGIIVLTVGASLFIMNNLYHNMSAKEVTTRLAQEEGIYQIGGEETGACQETNRSHIVTIKNAVASPAHTHASRCDTLTFINDDDEKREIVFGSHPNYESYGGVFEIIIHNGHPETITLNETGDFVFHDHIDPDIAGYFSVTP